MIETGAVPDAATGSDRSFLVTGGAGNMGSELVRALAATPSNTVVVADNLSTGRLTNVPHELPNVFFERCNVNHKRDVTSLFAVYSFDIVFHFAAVVGVQRTLTKPLEVLKDIRGIELLLQFSQRSGVSRFCFSSSSEVYGEPVELPQVEDTTPLNSRLPYAVVKNLGEAFCRGYSMEYNLPVTVFRFFNTYGRRQTSDFVIPRFIEKALRNEPISVFGDGLQTRTFIHVDDVVDVCLRAIEGSNCVNEILNVGGDREYTMRELAELIIGLTGSSSQIVHKPARKEGDMLRRRPDVTKMHRLKTDFLTLDDGLREVIVQHRLRIDEPVDGAFLLH